MVFEKILILGRTAPEWSKREGDLVSCTVGITENFEWRRLRFATLDEVRDMSIFTWANIDMVQPKGRKKDPRLESRVLNPTNQEPIERLTQIEDRDVRKWYLEQCIQPSLAEMRRNKQTIGIIKPIELKYEVNPISADSLETKRTLLSWLPYDDPRRRAYEWKRRYSQKQIEIRFRFRCGPHCENKNPHSMKVLDLQFFLLYKNCARKRNLEETIDCVASKIESVHAKEDVYLGLGTHRYYPFLQYMVGGAFRFPKGLKPKHP